MSSATGRTSLLDQSELNKDPILREFSALLNSLQPTVQTQSTHEGLTLTLHFEKGKTEETYMRKIAALVADHVA